MSSQCSAAFDRIAHQLGGFTCNDAPAFVHLRSPFGLSNWTLAVVEIVMVAGAGLALWWSIRRWRREGDPTNLALWFASVVYLLVTEIPLYFPDVFGVQEPIGVVFAHNVFTVQFMFERLPLYIVALYPAVTTLAFEIVRSLGVFSRRHGVLAGAICVGFVHHCFYEIFDQLGPQLRWWQWNVQNPLNHPMFDSVPMTSWFLFATVGPAALTLMVMWLVGRPCAHGRGLGPAGLVWRIFLAGVLVPIAMTVPAMPASVAGEHVAVKAVVFAVEMVIVAAVTLPVLVGQACRLRRGQGGDGTNLFVRIYGPLYLGVLAVLWLSALPAHLGADNGVTADATPTGNASYALACFAMSAVWVTVTGYLLPEGQQVGQRVAA